MAFKKDNVKTEAKLSLRSGGEIDDNFLDFRINECMKKIFVEAQLLSIPRYINVPTPSKKAPIDLTSDQVFMSGSSNISDNIKYSNLYKVQWTTSSVDKEPANTKSRKLIRSSEYYIGISDPSNTNQEIIFYSDYEQDEQYDLELWSFASSTEESMVAESYSRDFYDAVLEDVKYYFTTQQGRPWFDANQSIISLRAFAEAMRKLKINANKSFTRRETKAKPVYSFI